MIKRGNAIQFFLNALAEGIGGMTQAQAEAKGVCLICKQKVTGFKDELSRVEYGISGSCQRCQDKLFTAKEGEDE